MTAKDEWILFLEKNPQFNELAKSSLYISMLKLLKTESLTIDKIHISFPRVENNDLDLILKSLIKLKLVYKVRAGNYIVYTLTPKGHELLGTYERAKEGFKIE